MAAGVLGLVANVLLIAFFGLAKPFSTGGDAGLGWLGTANDAVVAGQFLTLIPVAAAVRRLLPPTRVLTAATVVGVVAMACLVLLQLALIGGLLTFDVQVRMVAVVLLGVYGWLLTVSSSGHQTLALPPTVTRVGLLLGLSYPVALLLVLAGLVLAGLLPSGTVPAHLVVGLPGAALLVPGLVLGSLGWLALPLWPLLLARTVLGLPRTERSTDPPTLPAATPDSQEIR